MDEWPDGQTDRDRQKDRQTADRQAGRQTDRQISLSEFVDILGKHVVG